MYIRYRFYIDYLQLVLFCLMMTLDGKNNIISTELESIEIAKTVMCGVDDVSNFVPLGLGNLSIISQNIRSISRNFDPFYALLLRSQVDWDIIILTECWLHDPRPIPVLDGYNSIHTLNNLTQNEGVVIYYKPFINVRHEEPSLSDANCLTLKIDSTTCIIAIYRPPSYKNILNFIDSFDSLLRDLSQFKNIIIMGDINIDISPLSSDSRHNEYLDLLATYGILPAHNIPTHGRTCLDHAMIKTKELSYCFIIESDITDHEAVALSVNIRSQKYNYGPYV